MSNISVICSISTPSTFELI